MASTGITIIFAIIAFLAFTVYHLIRKTIWSKKYIFLVLVAFSAIAIAAGCTDSSLNNSAADKTAVEQSISLQQQEKEDVLEPFVPWEEQQPETSSSTESSVSDKQEPVEVKIVISGNLKVHFIDVGQADSILIQLPSSQNILIDGGNNDDGTLIVNYLKQQGVKRLDYVIGTHPHEDHIGSLDFAIRSFKVGKVYLPKVVHTSKTYEDLLLAIKDKGLTVTQAKAGVKLDVGPGIEAVMLSPNSSIYDDLNNYSAVLKLTYGDTSFLFTGDAEAESENEMLAAGYNLRADVLKVGHHGSNSSTTPTFLKAVSPKYAVISVGKDNKYGHPHPETLAKLSEAGVQIFRTDLQGTIVAVSDGKTITFNKKASPIKERAPNDFHATADSSISSVKIADIDLKNEIVTIKNTSGAEVDISGWKLVSIKGNQIFIFPSGTVIPAGGSLKIVSGPKAHAESDILVWTKSYIWNNNGDPGALYNTQGKLVSQYK